MTLAQAAGAGFYRTSLADDLGSIAAREFCASHARPSFIASCQLVSDLAAAAALRSKDRGSVLHTSLGANRRLHWLLGGERDASELRAVFTALQQHLGWSAQEAGATLLGLGLQTEHNGKQRVSAEGAPPLPLHLTSTQRIEEVASLLG